MSALDEVQKDVRQIEQSIGGPEGINVRLKALETDVEAIKTGLDTLIARPANTAPASFTSILSDPKAFAQVLALVAAIGSAVAGSGWYAGRATAAPVVVNAPTYVPATPETPEVPAPTP